MPSRNEELPLAVEIEQTEEQLHVLDGLAQAMSEPHAVLDVVMESDDVDEAVASLCQQLGLDEVQARAVVDLQFRQVSKLVRRKREERRGEVSAHLEFLRSLTDE